MLIALLCFVLSACNLDKTDKVTAEQKNFEATVLSVNIGSLLIEPSEGTKERNSSDQIEISNISEENSLEYLKQTEIGDKIEVRYSSDIEESYPARISEVTKISLIESAQDILSDIIPTVMVDGILYSDTGRESEIDARCGVMDGEITSTVIESEIPTKNNQSNFGKGYGYQRVAEDIIEVYRNGKWCIFEPIHEDETQTQDSGKIGT